MNESLAPFERIRKKSDFSGLYRNGRRFRGRHFTLVYRRNGLDFSRLAVVVSRKVGPAVVRNRIKRRFRELFRRNKGLLAEPLDLIVVARPDAAAADWPGLKDAFISALTTIFRKRISS
jgi:ribonuclease P protein component